MIDQASAGSSGANPEETPARLGIVLVGNPNVGKSALFGALTGTYVTVSNYPGTTVEVTTGEAVVGGRRIPLVDTPGAFSFLPSSEDERVTRDILLSGKPDAVMVVGDAKSLDRALLLALQIAEMEIPHILCLNMMDEAEASGIGLDIAALTERLGVPVVPTVAVRHQGLRQLLFHLASPGLGRRRPSYPDSIRSAIAEIAPLLPRSTVSAQSLAVMALSGDATLSPWLQALLPPESLIRIETVRNDLARQFGDPLAYVINQARLNTVAQIGDHLTSRTARSLRATPALLERLDRYATHSLWGLPFLAVVLCLFYLFVGVFGAGTLVDLLDKRLFGSVIAPAAISLANRFLPFPLLRDLLVGPYGLITMALAYALALILPIVATFFLAFGVLEDSGYLPRLAVMANRLFRSIGLNGKAVLPMVLGLGCDTMATMTARILETPKERLTVMLLLALGIPCSAQLTVILALMANQPMSAWLIWASVVGGVLLLVGRLAARVLPGRGSDFILEIPPLRPPQLRNLLVKTLARIEWYLKEAVPLFVLGTLLLFAADRLRLLGVVEEAAEPLVVGLLGLPRETATSFVVGFLRRDFGAAGLFRLAREGRLDAVQILVAIVTITLFIPCIANFLMIVKERGWRAALGIAGFIFPFALAVGATLNWVLNIWTVR